MQKQRKEQVNSRHMLMPSARLSCSSRSRFKDKKKSSECTFSKTRRRP